tara:strand:+ start:423 stop:620 length:198 start_codon:yes stop_codon:yes gene_type:complete
MLPLQESDEKIAERVKAMPNRQLVSFIDLAIEILNYGSFHKDSIEKVIKVSETLERFKYGHVVSR